MKYYDGLESIQAGCRWCSVAAIIVWEKVRLSVYASHYWLDFCIQLLHTTTFPIIIQMETGNGGILLEKI